MLERVDPQMLPSSNLAQAHHVVTRVVAYLQRRPQPIPQTLSPTGASPTQPPPPATVPLTGQLSAQMQAPMGMQRLPMGPSGAAGAHIAALAASNAQKPLELPATLSMNDFVLLETLGMSLMSLMSREQNGLYAEVKLNLLDL